MPDAQQILQIAVLTFAVVVAPNARAIDQPGAAYVAPRVPLEVALKLAKQAMPTRTVDVSAHFLSAVRLDSSPRGGRGPSWQVTWQPRAQAKGGVIFVHVYMDRTTEVIYGE